MNPHIGMHREIVTAVRVGIGLSGHIKLRKGKTIGGIVDVSTGQIIPGSGHDVVIWEGEWFNNIITNLGLDKIANTSFLTCTVSCHVGTGTALETATDTALQSFLASTTNVESSTTTVQGSAPYYASNTRTFRFNPGQATGNISEIGFSSQSTNGEEFSRARVKDGGGSPTTITVLSDEWLDVTYQFRGYPDHILSNGSPDDGSGSVTYDVSHNYTIRPSRVNNSTYWVATAWEGNIRPVGASLAEAFSTQTLGAVTSVPSGSASGVDTLDSTYSKSTYSAGAYNRDVTIAIGLNDANVSGGVGSLSFHTAMGAYQMSFTPKVDKTASKVWNFVQNLAWARATIP